MSKNQEFDWLANRDKMESWEDLYELTTLVSAEE